MSPNRRLLWLATIGTVLIAAGSITWVLWPRPPWGVWEVACVGRLHNLWLVLGDTVLSSKEMPISDEVSRRGSELNAVLALRQHLSGRLGEFRCLAYAHDHGSEGINESYRMPDWTREQWKRAGHFKLELRYVPSPWQDRYSAPVIWDTEPVHNGTRNVLFYHGAIRRRVPEEIFQQLRKASEESVRGETAHP